MVQCNKPAIDSFVQCDWVQFSRADAGNWLQVKLMLHCWSPHYTQYPLNRCRHESRSSEAFSMRYLGLRGK